jgi:hypothetical protein
MQGQFMSPLEFVEKFFERWAVSHQEMRQSFRDCMAKECE